MSGNQPYQEQKYDLSNLNGISDKQLEIHFGLYAGYVKNTNLLNEQIGDLLKNGKGGTPEYAELKRRLGFEYNGMRLHEYYFGNMTKSPQDLASDSKLHTQINNVFGSYDNWKTDFVKVGTMRGVGWAMLYQDPTNGNLSNHWITLHEDGHPAGFTPLLVMDVWEHAFMVDYKPAERAKYIEAFFSNICWNSVEKRMS
ncbi:MAG: superoxide dismutase [Blastocatellia bacterium]|nr:superoxide dismutase [Blastocatellia bacterium]MBL8196367.1 superoxide dismutase [Blastocatellia bacterium]MBN8721725.1 superoxide dismutase [Acidobacteriota bacterium]